MHAELICIPLYSYTCMHVCRSSVIIIIVWPGLLHTTYIKFHASIYVVMGTGSVSVSVQSCMQLYQSLKIICSPSHSPPAGHFPYMQSDPALKPVNGVRQHTLPVKEKFDHVNNRLAALNRALARMEEEEGPDYSMESIERPRKRNEIKKRLSYVEHSYNKLTNDTYTSDSIHGTRNTVHLDDWGQ